MARTTKQAVFVEEYLRCWNATEAAKRAGYSEKTAYSSGQRLLKDVEIAAEIQARIEERAMSADEVLDRLAQHARGSIEDFVDVDSGMAIVDLRKARDAGKLHLAKKIRYFKEGGVEVELYDAQAALEKLGKAHGLFKDVSDINVKGLKTYIGVSPDDWDEDGRDPD